jgi:hypothetical protein
MTHQVIPNPRRWCRKGVRVGDLKLTSSKPILGVNDLQSQFPEIAAEAYGWDPKTVVKGSGRIKDWICSKGHIYSNRVVNRIRGDGCVFCSGRRVLKGFNDLQTKFPDIAAEAYGWDPSLMSSGNDEKKDWICKQGHIYPSRVANRTNLGRGCPFCSGREAIAGINDLQTKFPDIAAEAYGWDPKTVTSTSGKKKEWKCSQGHIYPSVVASRTKGGTGCPFCSGREVMQGINDLQTKFPDIAAEAYGWDPKTVTSASNKKKRWKCSQGHIFPAVVGMRTIQGTQCPYCAGKKVLAGFNDLQCKFADLAAEAFGWDPTTLTAGSNKMRNWKCKEGHIYPCLVSNRTNGRGCPVCAEYGFNPEKDAWFYLMERSGEQQLGITNELDVRMKAHERNGWTLLEHTEPALGNKVRETELLFKQWLRKEIGLIKGTTENWSTTKMEVQSLSELKARSGIETDLF